ncbi:peptide chain release factor 1 [Petrotoga sp. 9PW.55.5.1]|uniref:peptide chain release factor 1 n=1 Tax=Petrotoga sp. 9PW.55.5.1 TaxID=1308979 RepID=UPI000DC5ED80|nr:peptide chain release factor 1 [Petrotoga sp. 9PW.55.5.1]RAO99404.1 peptide chain release factor 1 [Petrotoga sp. 9PW.55.5.1]
MNILDFKEEVKKKIEELEKQLSDPEVTNDVEQLKKLGQDHSRLSELDGLFSSYEEVLEDKKTLKEMYDDGEISEEEYQSMLSEIEKKEGKIEKRILEGLVTQDKYDERNIIMEIRAGTGGDEASLFASELMRMYLRYAERKGWKYETLDLNENELGGIKTAIIKIKGKDVYRRFKYESGVHRVQRVPQTESSGRIHTSTATVAVLPEATDIDVQINENDLRIDTYRASGAGGQYVNKTDSAVRITHLPTGIVVTCQNERSQHQNKEKALNILRTKLFEIKLNEQQSQLIQERKSQIGSGDRSEKIRTYNFPQNRITDHRIHYTTHRINELLDGDLDEIIDKLIERDLKAKLESLTI